MSAAACQRYVENGSYMVGSEDQAPLQYRVDQLFVPASTLKVATSLIALRVLGPHYRFPTEFYFDARQRLTIKGYGDPLLTSDHLVAIAQALKQRGVHAISTLILDASAFRLTTPADGTGLSQNPYDAPNGALAVNFNSIHLVKTPSGSIVSGEKETPFIPLMDEIGRHLPPGRHRVNIAAFQSETSPDIGLRHVAELIRATFQAAGIALDGTYQEGTVEPGSRLIYTYDNPNTLVEVIRDCLKFSNNFMANQLFLASGASRFGYPATWSKGRQAATLILTEMLPEHRLSWQIVEGSGISRKNRVSARFMTAIMQEFKPYAELLPIEHEVPNKSGTLHEVYCFVGYLPDQTTLEPFVILLNQHANRRTILLDCLHDQHDGAKPSAGPGETVRALQGGEP